VESVAAGVEEGRVAAVAGTPSQQARRHRIVTAALELLETREYDRIQVRDVAESANVALGTLYRYFPSKEQLFAEVLVEWSRTFETSVRSRSRATTDAQRLKALLRRAAAAFERHPNFFRLLAALERVNDPAVTRPFREYSDHVSGVLEEALEDTDRADAALITRMTLAFLDALLKQWAVGQVSMASVYAQLDRAVDLVFAAPVRPD